MMDLSLLLVLFLCVVATLQTECEVPRSCVEEKNIRVNCTDLTTTQDVHCNRRDYNLNNNNFQSLDAKSFKVFTDMAYLTLQNCKIQNIDVATFQFNPKLMVLNLGNNKIKTLPANLFQNTQKLQRFSCENNNLTTIDNGLFKGLIDLEYVRLNGNQITSISRYAFQDLADLQVLYLMNNQLRTPHWKWIAHFNHTGKYELYFDGNPWSCDCKMNNFLTKLLKNSWYIQKESQLVMPTCHQPPNLKGRLVTRLQLNELICIKPNMTSSNGTIIANEGSPSSFKCSGKGLPTPQVYITDEGDRKVTKVQIGVVYLNFTKTTLDVAGEYKCFANGTNPSNHITVVTTTFNIKVKPLPPSAAGIVVSIVILLLIVGVVTSVVIRRRHKRSGYGSLRNDDPVLYEINDDDDGLMTSQITEHVNRYPDDDVTDDDNGVYSKNDDDKEVLV